MNRDEINIGLIGCGNIGFRHLQALVQVQLKQPFCLFIVEPNEAQHEKISAFLSESQSDADFKFQISSDLTNLPATIDLAVIATNSGDRFAAFEKLLQHSEAKAIIFEKVLFQTIAELDQVEALLKEKHIAAYVNYGRRAFPTYQTLAKQLEHDKLINIKVKGSSFGLACNGLHFIDLFEMLSKSELIVLNGDALNPGYEESKRNSYIEIYGTLSGETSSGSLVEIQCDSNMSVAVRIEIETKNGKILIDETAHTILDERNIPNCLTVDFKSYFVSQTPFLYQSIIEEQSCLLTGYEQAAKQHRLFIPTINKHLGLPSLYDTVCRIS